MINAIVTDIEGTTSSIHFVHEVLFPYSKKYLKNFLQQHHNDQNIIPILNEVREIIQNKNADLHIIETTLMNWINEDRKITVLKTLQGLIWQQGFENGELKAHIYPDADEYLNKWYLQNIKLYVYSSGSVFAQKLFFAHSEFGDLTSIFKGYFDTTIGAKREQNSYQAIADTINVTSEHILFLSDIKEELDAAKQVGMKTYWLIREGKVPENPEHPVARNFSEIEI